MRDQRYSPRDQPAANLGSCLLGERRDYDLLWKDPVYHHMLQSTQNEDGGLSRAWASHDHQWRRCRMADALRLAIIGSPAGQNDIRDAGQKFIGSDHWLGGISWISSRGNLWDVPTGKLVG